MLENIEFDKPIYIGQDSNGPLIEIKIRKINGKYIIEPIIHHDVDNKRLITLRENLKSLISLKEENGKLKINIIGKDKDSKPVQRCLGEYDSKGNYIPRAPLTTLELKMLSLGKGNENYDRVFSGETLEASPLTDLHTHYTGQLRAKEVYDIALKTAPETVVFSSAKLVKSGVLPPDHKYPDYVSLDILDKEVKDFRAKMIDLMEINIQDQITFMDMDDRYVNRGPFFDSDNPELVRNYILKIAENYAKSGVKYCELSVCTWMFQGSSPQESEYRHKMFKDAVSEAKEKYGVDIAFLLATPRQKRDNTSLMNFTRSFINEANFPLVAGIDLLGHEKTSNKDYAYIFAAAANLCAKNGWKHFTIRSHAGESEEYEDNIKDFLKAVLSEIDVLKKKGEIKDPDFYPDIRIGHGLHGGLDEETLALIKQTGAIIEINASSNLSLNNINELKQIPIRKYLDMGVRVVLGSDGAGLYGTDARQEALIAQQLGVTKQELREMMNFERGYIDNKLKEANERGKKDIQDYIDYIPESVDLPGITRVEVQYNTNEINKDLENDPPIFVCGAENRYPDEEMNNRLKNDILKIVSSAKENGKRICIYNDGSYINGLVEAACKEYGVNLVKLESVPVKDGERAYGIDKFEVSRSVGRFYGKNKGQVFIMGGGAFASDLIVNCENNKVDWKSDKQLPGASQEQAIMRSKENDVKQQEKEEQRKNQVPINMMGQINVGGKAANKPTKSSSRGI